MCKTCGKAVDSLCVDCDKNTATSTYFFALRIAVCMIPGFITMFAHVLYSIFEQVFCVFHICYSRVLPIMHIANNNDYYVYRYIITNRGVWA
jgi:predicted CDP-diglyceride synthetase/phosphatidate cytidylyltransferase